MKKNKNKNPSKRKHNEINMMSNIGATLVVAGLFVFGLSPFFPKEDVFKAITFTVLGLLAIVIGAGLYVLGVSVTDIESRKDIKIYIGKQLFEKGLYGFVVGVILGIFSILTK